MLVSMPANINLTYMCAQRGITSRNITYGGALDQNGEVVDVYLQARRDGAAAKRFLKRLLRSHGAEPGKIVMDKLRSYDAGHRELIPEAIHDTSQYANNRAEQSHETTRVLKRGMRRFKSMVQAQRFVIAHASVQNLFNLGWYATALRGLSVAKILPHADGVV